MKTILAKTSNRQYSIYIERGISKKAAKVIKGHFAGAQKVIVVTNDRVYPIYEELIDSVFGQAGLEFFTHVIKDGEIYKSLDTSRQLFDVLLKNNFHRNDLVIAFGGGVVGDLAGFVASTYHRGLKLLQYPTTIIGQVDSSIGGKVAVNYEGIKNIIGTFYQPHMIIMDPGMLETLDRDEVINGLGEVVKYGIVFDKKILLRLEKIIQRKKEVCLLVKDRAFEDIIYRCAKIKAGVVAKDEFDSGYRNLLNFGHTIGHAIEKASKLTDISHGQAVGLGMLVAIDISIELGLVKGDIKERIIALYDRIGLLVKIGGLEAEAIAEATGFDKKFTAKKNKFVLLKGLNKPFFYYGLKKDIIINSINNNIGKK
ncbi:MAG: 3-dehydroquinate synthase [Actinomycetota bacterium]